MQIQLPDNFKVGIYAMNDSAPDGVFQINPEHAHEYNQNGNGIFWTLNEFKGQRIISNLVNVLRWGVDIDDGEKNKQLEKIVNAPLPPSEINETKRGYQICYYAKEASPQYWNAIVLDRLVPYFGGDRRARDLCRIFRVPGYYHNKDPKNPFMVKNIHYHPERIYTERMMAYMFEDMSVDARKEFKQKIGVEFNGSENFFINLFNYDHSKILEHLSGHEIVKGDVYSFKKQQNGNLNIYSNGKSTSTFIDKQGRIGSLDGGGPTAVQWLTWYGHSKRTAIDFIKKEFPCLNKSN